MNKKINNVLNIIALIGCLLMILSYSGVVSRTLGIISVIYNVLFLISQRIWNPGYFKKWY